jgi:hypothetical protein
LDFGVSLDFGFWILNFRFPSPPPTAFDFAKDLGGMHGQGRDNLLLENDPGLRQSVGLLILWT